MSSANEVNAELRYELLDNVVPKLEANSPNIIVVPPVNKKTFKVNMIH